MRVRCIEHIDSFAENEYVFWLEVEDIPKEFIEKAKEIDKNEFDKSCFGICVTCNNGWTICENEDNYELFYIDNNGNKNWMKYKLTDKEAKEAVEFCQNDLDFEI